MPEKSPQFEGGDFLKDKYWGNEGFREAADISACRTEIREGERVPNKPQERIENYLNRFTEITDREDPEKRERGIAAIERLNENFGKLYAFMQEHVRSLKLPTERLIVAEGEWRVFPKGTSATELTAPLQTFQTKWCIAGEGHAASHLETGDVWIYLRIFHKSAKIMSCI